MWLEQARHGDHVQLLSAGRAVDGGSLGSLGVKSGSAERPLVTQVVELPGG